MGSTTLGNVGCQSGRQLSHSRISVAVAFVLAKVLPNVVARVSGLIEGATVTEFAAERWSVELVGWEGVLDNWEGTGQMV